jgi:cytochrome oxidase Cu insertion factor (SCO1/SenC/PrrC family)
MELQASADEAARATGRRKLLVIAALFFLPLALSFAMYYGNLWRPAASSNHGTLLSPVVALESVPGDLSLRDKWSLIYVGDGACDQACKDTLAFGRQVRLSLNNEMTRVQRVFLATGNCCDSSYLQREHAGLVVSDLSREGGARLLAQFPANDRANTLFIVDPLGNLLMRYDAREPPKGLQSDLKKLLKLSHIG